MGKQRKPKRRKEIQPRSVNKVKASLLLLQLQKSYNGDWVKTVGEKGYFLVERKQDYSYSVEINTSPREVYFKDSGFLDIYIKMLEKCRISKKKKAS